MKFFDNTRKTNIPQKINGKWDYSVEPLYKNLLNVFWETQRPVDKFKNSNSRLRDPFRKMNNNKIGKMLGHIKDPKPYRKIKWVEDDNGNVMAVLVLYEISIIISKIGFKKLNN